MGCPACDACPDPTSLPAVKLCWLVSRFSPACCTSLNPAATICCVDHTFIPCVSCRCLSDYQCCTNDDITLARVTSGTFASAHSSPATAPASPAVYGAPAVPGMNPKRPSTGGPAHSSSTSAAGTGGLASLVQTLPPIGKGQQQGGGKGNSSPSTAVQDARAASIIRRLRGFFRLRNMQHI
jgi:hypothetical protein